MRTLALYAARIAAVPAPPDPDAVADADADPKAERVTALGLGLELELRLRGGRMTLVPLPPPSARGGISEISERVSLGEVGGLAVAESGLNKAEVDRDADA